MPLVLLIPLAVVLPLAWGYGTFWAITRWWPPHEEGAGSRDARERPPSPPDYQI